MDVLEEYERGVDSYWAGSIPRGWENSNWDEESVSRAITSPYIMGWYQASLADNGMI